MTNSDFWKTKLAAWVHDPAEKALVLLRGKSHEEGTVKELCRELFGSDRIPGELGPAVERADHWAAAADRAELPWKQGERYPAWASVSFTKDPEIVHPVSPGLHVNITGTFKDASVGELEAVSLDHFKDFIVQNGAGPDYRKTYFRFWRFGPETPAKDLNLLWQVLPADTRSPDHTIWDHLKLSSALGSIFSTGDVPALLAVSLGPVQGFIAQARSTSDLWAGSHFLSRMSFEAMRPVVEKFGPDCILFPDLHGVPAMDQWLAEQGLWPENEGKPWERSDGSPGALDRDPRMAAALPNRFLALVPAGRAGEIGKKIADEVTRWARDRAEAAAERFFRKAGRTVIPDVAKEQVERQMQGFPEIHWTSIPWSLVGEADGRVDVGRLMEMLGRFHPEGSDPAGEIDGTWDVFSRPARDPEGGWAFYRPNPGAAYFRLYGLSDRFHAATKSLRPFENLPQEGYRCTACGEREWLTDNRDRLAVPFGSQADGDPWKRLGEEGAGPVRKGEHLCAWCTLKRFWPSIYPEEIGAGGSRFVVSTHTMALAPSIEAALGRAGEIMEKHGDDVRRLAASTNGMNRAAFPRRLWKKLSHLEKENDQLYDALARLPVFLDTLADRDETDRDETDDVQEQKDRGIVKNLLGADPEAYYALVLMDGDRMGEWVSGLKPDTLPTYREILHSRTADLLAREFGEDSEIGRFLSARRLNTPARHQGISRGLNHFSLALARTVVEEIFTGKLIYAGGDDLMAMVSLPDLPGLMLALRALYSGVLLSSADDWQSLTGRPADGPDIRLAKGYALLSAGGKKRLYATMGPGATASMGAVIAHHKAPLGRVLRSLRSAERRAKDAGGRDAFCLTIEKRAGGTSHLVGKWWKDGGEPCLADTTMSALLYLRDALAVEGVSRRAAYVIHDQLRDIPPEQDAIEKNIAFRLGRQGVKGDRAESLGRRLAELAIHHEKRFRETSKKCGGDEEIRDGKRGEVATPNRWLQEFFITAEFLARRADAEKGGEAA